MPHGFRHVLPGFLRTLRSPNRWRQRATSRLCCLGLHLSVRGCIPIRLGTSMLDLRFRNTECETEGSQCGAQCLYTVDLQLGHCSQHAGDVADCWRARLWNVFVGSQASCVLFETRLTDGSIFACFNVAIVFVAYFFVIETKGVSLERMDELFGVAKFDNVEELGEAVRGTKRMEVEHVDQVENVHQAKG